MQTFLTNDLPAVQTGHYLLRRRAVSAERTWTTVDQAVEWLCQQYARHAPVQRSDGRQAYVELEPRVEITRDGLTHGVDALWWYYTAGSSVAVTAVICCPHAHLRQIPCPLPPS